MPVIEINKEPVRFGFTNYGTSRGKQYLMMIQNGNFETQIFTQQVYEQYDRFPFPFLPIFVLILVKILYKANHAYTNSSYRKSTKLFSSDLSTKRHIFKTSLGPEIQLDH